MNAEHDFQPALVEVIDETFGIGIELGIPQAEAGRRMKPRIVPGPEAGTDDHPPQWKPEIEIARYVLDDRPLVGVPGKRAPRFPADAEPLVLRRVHLVTALVANLQELAIDLRRRSDEIMERRQLANVAAALRELIVRDPHHLQARVDVHVGQPLARRDDEVTDQTLRAGSFACRAEPFMCEPGQLSCGAIECGVIGQSENGSDTARARDNRVAAVSRRRH